jgi:hypothetical protein
VALPPGNGATAGTFLVDGMWQGTWQIRDQTLRIQPFIKLCSADRDALLAGWAGAAGFELALGLRRDDPSGRPSASRGLRRRPTLPNRGRHPNTCSCIA